MKKRVILFLPIFLYGFPFLAHALRCGGKLVLDGDRKVEVAMKCGEPDLVERWEEELVRYGGRAEKVVISASTKEVEQWTYNFGSNRFIHFLTFINGRLEKIETGSYGYDGAIPPDSDKTRCGSMVEKGDRKIDVLMKCGEPFFRERRQEDRHATEHHKRFRKDAPDRKGRKDLSRYGDSSPFVERRVEVKIEEWTYNFGSSHFLSFITFENGRVMKVEQGGYGYSR